jgi:hypothetical protein
VAADYDAWRYEAAFRAALHSEQSAIVNHRVLLFVFDLDAVLN